MVYYGRQRWNNSVQTQNTNNRVSDPTLKTRLEKLISNPDVQKNQASLQFMKSLLDQFNKYHSLSEKQAKCIADNEAKYDSSSAASKEFLIWSQEYDEQKKADAIKVADWYKQNHERGIDPDTGTQTPYYFQYTAEKVLSDPNYIPAREAYDKMVGNKFAQSYLEITKEGSRFTAGDLAELSSNKKALQLFQTKFPQQTCLVINVALPRKAIVGGYIITVLPTGTDVMIDIEERWLKTVRI